MFGKPEAKFRITAEDKSSTALKQVKTNLSGVHKGVGAVSAAIGPMMTAFAGASAAVGGAAGLINKFSELGAGISDAAAHMGITTDSFQALEFAALDAGTKSEVMERGLTNLKSRTIQAQGAPTGPHARAWRTLGYNAAGFDEHSADKLLDFVARGYAGAEDKGKAWRAGQVLVGEEAWPKLTEVVERVAAEGMARMVEDARRNRGFLSEKDVMASDEAKDAMGRWGRQARGMAGKHFVTRPFEFGEDIAWRTAFRNKETPWMASIGSSDQDLRDPEIKQVLREIRDNTKRAADKEPGLRSAFR